MVSVVIDKVYRSVLNKRARGDTLSVRFTAVGNESGFPIIYEARLVTASGDIPIGEGATSPIVGTLPPNLLRGSYTIKVATKNAIHGRTAKSRNLGQRACPGDNPASLGCALSAQMGS